MRQGCHFLLTGCFLLLAACHSAPPAAPPAPAPVPLNQLVPPATLGSWQQQGSIGQDGQMHVFRYLDTGSQVLDLSLYPLPDGWQDLPAEQALNRHFGMLAQQLSTSAQRKYRAERVEVAEPHVETDGASGQPHIDARFTSHFNDGATRITLVSLSLCRGNFLRLTTTTLADKAAALAQVLAATRATLDRELCQQETAAATHE